MKKKILGYMMACTVASTMMLPMMSAQAETTEAATMETTAKPDTVASATKNAEKPAKTVKTKAKAQKKATRTWEVQAEYLEGRFFKKRHIDDYNLHIYQKNREVNHIGIWYGLTLSRPVGYTTEDNIYRDSEAVGFGPSVMLRWERPLTGKLHGSIDGTGSLLFYNQAHPGDGRAYGFLWRIGPRLIYQATDTDAVSLGYLFHHSSNGMHSHNPGYNGVGFSLGWTHTF